MWYYPHKAPFRNGTSFLNDANKTQIKSKQICTHIIGKTILSQYLLSGKEYYIALSLTLILKPEEVAAFAQE